MKHSTFYLFSYYGIVLGAVCFTCLLTIFSIVIFLFLSFFPFRLLFFRLCQQVFKEEEEAVKVDLHEGCGRIKLYWTMALADSRTLKGMVEFRDTFGG